MNGGLFQGQWWEAEGQAGHVDEMSLYTRPRCVEIKVLLTEAFCPGLSLFFVCAASLITVISSPLQGAQRSEPQQEFRAEPEEVQGSWGAWGAWSTCSQTCGRGVKEQRRPCLPVYTQSQYPSKRVGVFHQQAGRVVSALRPTFPLHGDAGRSSNSSSHGQLKQTHPGVRRYCISVKINVPKLLFILYEEEKQNPLLCINKETILSKTAQEVLMLMPFDLHGQQIQISRDIEIMLFLLCHPSLTSNKRCSVNES